MKATLSVTIELSSPVNVRSAYELAQLDRNHVSRVTVLLTPTGDGTESRAPALELGFDFRHSQLIDLIEFVQAGQGGGTVVTLSYQGRCEEFLL